MTGPDLSRYMDNKSLGIASYFLDDKIQSSKFSIPRYFKEFKRLAENKQSKKIKTLKSVSSSEFCLNEVENYLNIRKPLWNSNKITIKTIM